jgi:hypothetical protein
VSGNKGQERLEIYTLKEDASEAQLLKLVTPLEEVTHPLEFFSVGNRN